MVSGPPDLGVRQADNGAHTSCEQASDRCAFAALADNAIAGCFGCRMFDQFNQKGNSTQKFESICV